MTGLLLDDHPAKAAVNDLQVECAAIEVLLVHLVSRLAGEHASPREWLRGFADDLHASVDRAAAPTEPQAQRMAEALRDRLDKLMHGAGMRLAK
jgi:hypothetical protein